MTPSLPMTCPQCGQQNSGEARFCGSCGALLVAPAPTPASPTSGSKPRRGWPWRFLVLWPIIAVGILLVLFLLLPQFGRSFLFLILTLIPGWPVAGLFLWAGATGRWWPQGQRRVPAVLRVLLLFLALVLNGVLGAFVGMLAFGLSEGGISRDGASLIGMTVFAVISLLELGSFFLIWGVAKLVLLVRDKLASRV